MYAIGMVLLLELFAPVAVAQGKTFAVKKQNWASPFKEQGNNGCPFFSMTSFFESEGYRISGWKTELSQMYLFYHVFIEKTERYLWLRGIETYSTGGLFDDAFYIMGKYGAVPLADYPGLRSPNGALQHGPLYGEFEYRFLPLWFEKAKNHELGIRWQDGKATKPWLPDLTTMLDRNLGKLPETVNYEGKTYTPVEFAREVVALDLDNYVRLVSYSGMLLYRPEPLFVKDNWLMRGDFYSLPLEEFIETIDYAISHNFTLAIDMDITPEQLADSTDYCTYREGEQIGQNTRDELLDNWFTKDVHLVHLTGIATDENGQKYYIIKDSVGRNIGAFTKKYLSENFVRAKVLAVLVHKDGIPSPIRKQLMR
jgi:bleomycin hydrolase